MLISSAALKLGSPTELDLPAHENSLAGKPLSGIKIENWNLSEPKNGFTIACWLGNNRAIV